MKKLAFIQKNNQKHWVGDGFPVQSIFSYHRHAEALSPFLLLDYAAPTHFDPTKYRRGVGAHPHRGFETVTIVYEGEVAHRDSTGAGGTIGRGDVQWMTAGSGIVHEEFHGENYRKTGGPFEMVQLWVNLPKKDKMTLPGYQGILSQEIPEVELKDQAGTVRVIAGEFGGSKGPARTFSAMNVWDVRLNSGKRSRFSVPDGHTTAFLVLDGEVQVADGESVKSGEMGVMDRAGSEFELTAQSPSKLLFLIGKPLNEPVVGHGPFVMNTETEIHQAFIDYESGKMGRLSS